MGQKNDKSQRDVQNLIDHAHDLLTEYDGECHYMTRNAVQVSTTERACVHRLDDAVDEIEYWMETSDAEATSAALSELRYAIDLLNRHQGDTL